MKYINFEDAGDAVSDEIYMREALKEAQKALEQDEVPIGAVIVCNGKIIGRGHNLTERLNDVTAHAEMQAFTAAANYLGGKYLLDCTLYVTIEPCVMCAGAAYWTQITRIVFGAIDKKRGFSGFGRDLLHPKTTVISGVLGNECAALVTSFFRNKRNK
ncbi:tRNA(adenine34) deaminase [Parapedobacter luteus]|uniref:tRNA-specific adenosine deaminase n=1 Tax=Parapedobacter luteus TaxID=623280 RepID=A0A1T5BSG5_9SPHI|nr:nucleoside deaminase [Parapedobacter luteus]SKB50091.1 tRNA(adenine34) deaminase [Parapedobacter luteus]